MTPRDTLRVAIAGAGMVAGHHVRAWRRLRNVDVVAVADPVPGRAASFARAHAIAAACEDAAAMLDDARPDALDIAAAHEAHGPLCRLAADRGVAILCQKPLAPTLDEARAIAADVGERVRFMVHENWHHRPWYREAMQRVRKGAVGRVRHLAITARGAGLLPDAGGRRPALARQPMLGRIERLVLGEVLVHHLDIACRICGDLRVEAALLRRDVAEVRGESAALLVLRGDGGATVVVDGDLAAHGAPARVADTFELLGDAGALRFDGRRLSGTGGALDYDPQTGYQASYDGAIAHFADALIGDRPFETPPAWHLRVLALAEAAYAQAGRA